MNFVFHSMNPDILIVIAIIILFVVLSVLSLMRKRILRAFTYMVIGVLGAIGYLSIQEHNSIVVGISIFTLVLKHVSNFLTNTRFL